MIAYASRTGTKRNLRELKRCGWRLMVSAKGRLRTEGFPYALDNGAWTSHQKGEPFDFEAFETAVEMLGANADFIVVPDIVAGGRESLDLSLEWLPKLSGICPLLLIAVQDGITVDEVRPVLGPKVGVFLGGSTPWKLATMREWGRLARARRAYFHVGRVNTANRIRACMLSGAHSFDGSGVSRFIVNLPRLNNARNQLPLFEVL